MVKRSKLDVKSAGEPPNRAASTPKARPPKKSPLLLALSVVLFAVWFVFLLISALLG